MNRRKRDNVLIFILLLVMAFGLFVMLHLRAEAVLGESARRLLVVETVSKLEGLPTMCDFGGCPVEKPKPTEPETELIFEEEPVAEPEQYEESDFIFEQEAYEEPEADNYDADDSLGIFTCTAYCGCTECSDDFGSMTAIGTIARPNHTIAVDPAVLSYGTKVSINGIVYTAEDCGGGVNGKHIDIYFESHAEACEFGVKSLEVFRAY